MIGSLIISKSCVICKCTDFTLYFPILSNTRLQFGAPTSQANFKKRYKKSWTPEMKHLSDFDVPRSKTRCTKPRDWEARVERENELLESLENVKKELPEDDDDFEAPSTSKQAKRVFRDENPEESENDSVFESDEDFQVEKPNPKKRKSDCNEDPPLPKKAKTKHDFPKKAKAKNASISKQIVR